MRRELLGRAAGPRTLSSEQARLTAPWADLCRPVDYRTEGWGVWLARRVGAAAMTLNRTVYVRPEYWRADAGWAALAVHEARHCEDQRIWGWPAYLVAYLGWKILHPRTVAWEHPLERECYALDAEVRDYWIARGE